MILFHLDWDLAYLGWLDSGPGASPAWMSLGHAVAGVFLFLSGFGLVLARPRGRAVTLRRLAVIAAVALGITAVTRWLFPEDYIFFGILHCIAVTNLIALPFLRKPVAVLAALAGMAALAPLILSSGSFDGPLWWWLGLSQDLPRTLDYRPVLPWLSPVLLGAGLARSWRKRPAWRARGRLAKLLEFAGRHSLVVYVAHQPLLLAALLLAGLIRGPAAADSRLDFSRQCRAHCTSAGAGQEGCAVACECVRVRLAPMLAHPTADVPARLHTPDQSDIEEASAACLGQGTPDLKGGKSVGKDR